MLYASTLGPAPLAFWMAGRNTVEGLLAAYLVNRYAGGRHALQTPRNSLRFAGLVLLSTASVGATFNALGVVLGGLAYWTDYGSLWLAQSLGSPVGMLLVAPVVISVQPGFDVRWRPRQVLEAVRRSSRWSLVGIAVFYGVPVELRGFPSELLCMPVLLWVAFRLGRRASAAAILALAVIAIVGTLNGYGPFVRARRLRRSSSCSCSSASRP